VEARGVLGGSIEITSSLEVGGHGIAFLLLRPQGMKNAVEMN